MSYLKALALSIFALALFAGSPRASAQISVGINIGSPPVCPYGYFDYAPYDCAPYGYYGPDWFDNGVFIGAGRWFHGPRGFSGHVDSRFDPRHGYRGPLPGRGAEQFNNFHGNEARDGKGHVIKDDHAPTNEHALPGYHGGSSHNDNHGNNHGDNHR